MAKAFTPGPVDVDQLRTQVQLKYSEVATNPEKGFHFHTGRPLARTKYEPKVNKRRTVVAR